jgi:hypothetical protein
MPTFTFDPRFPASLVAALACAGLLLAAYSYYRQAASRALRGVLGLLRLLVWVALAGVLLRPLEEVARPVRAARPLFWVLVDSSASMKTADMKGGSRSEAVRQALKKGTALAELGKIYDVRIRTFDGASRAAGPDWLAGPLPADGLKTDLAQALAEAGTAEPNRECAGLLLLSDGRDNGGGNPRDAAMLLKMRQIPAWTVCAGTPVDVRDVYLNARLSQNYLFVNQPGSLTVALSQSGFDKWHVNVHLYREEQYVATRQAILSASSSQIVFPLKEERKGLFRYRVTVDPLPGEGDVKNNARTLFARVVDEKSRALLVEARPYWDSKFLLRALQDDANLNVTTVFGLTRSRLFGIRETTSADTLRKESAEGAPELPRTRAELDRYDCLILGRGVDTLLPEETLKLLRGYVADRGGSIVFFRGRASRTSAELTALEPMIWEDEVLHDIRLDLTPDGQASPIFSISRSQPPDVLIRSLPPLISVTRVKQTRSLAVILAMGKGHTATQQVAAVAYQRLGKGKVMSVAPAGLWRWAFMPADMEEYRDVYRLFWSQMVRWLVAESDFLPGQDVAFHASRYTVQPGQPLQLAVATKNIDPAVYRPRILVRTPGGGEAVLTPEPVKGNPSDFQCLYTPAEEGEYRAVLHSNVGQPSEAEALFTVYSDMVETRFVASDEGLLAAIAEQTGGKALTLEELDTLPRMVEAFALQADRTVDRVDAWDKPPVFLFFVIVLGCEWFARRRAGLV